MRYTLIGLVLLSHFIAPGQHTYSAAEAKEDINVFRRALETTYPSIYRYSDSTSITNYLNKQTDHISGPQDALSIYRRIVDMCATLNDEHLIPTPPAWYYDSIKNAKHFFPFSIKLIDRRMYVLAGQNLPAEFPPGSEILSINGRSVEDLLNILLPTIPSDGYIQTFNYRHLEDFAMTQNENLFDLNYPIFVEDTNTFQIQYVTPVDKKEARTISVAGLDYSAYQAFYAKRRTWQPPLQFKYLQGNVGYMRIFSFHGGVRESFHQDFDHLYDSIFNDLNKRGTKSLILDLRNNEGGDNSGLKLLSYLMNKPYQLMDYLEEKFVGYPEVKQYLKNGDELFFIDSLVYMAPSGLYRLKKKYSESSPLFAMQKPAASRFKGRLYVLINGATGSMAAVVASFLKGYARGTFIGEESGGAMEGPTSMGYAELVLPNTNIRIEIPLTKSVHLLKYEKGRGVFPDYPVAPKILSIIKGEDNELQFALKLALKADKY